MRNRDTTGDPESWGKPLSRRFIPQDKEAFGWSGGKSLGGAPVLSLDTLDRLSRYEFRG